MTNNITINKTDGFGSQFLSIISGIAYAKINGLTYLHTPIQNLKLVDKEEFQNTDLDNANKLIDAVIENLNLRKKTEFDECINAQSYHKHIKSDGVEKYYNNLFLKELQDSYPKYMIKPNYYCDNNLNIAIHIRRGDDILEHDKPYRYIYPEIYENIIEYFKNKYPNAIIHIFSWNNSGIKEGKNIIFHTSKTGDVFIEDFNAMVHSDILVVGSSSFSMVAGLFNKNKVICSSDLFKCTDPIPAVWIKNYLYMEIDKKLNFKHLDCNQVKNNFKQWKHV